MATSRVVWIPNPAGRPDVVVVHQKTRQMVRFMLNYEKSDPLQCRITPGGMHRIVCFAAASANSSR